MAVVPNAEDGGSVGRGPQLGFAPGSTGTLMVLDVDGVLVLLQEQSPAEAWETARPVLEQLTSTIRWGR